MEANESIVIAAFYAVMGTLIFNSLRYDLKLNLLNSLFLSAGAFCILYHLLHNKEFGAWMSEYILAVIVLGILVSTIIVFGRSKNRESDDNISNQQ
jgi:FtsH-binding integral membrane protein